MTGSSVLLTIEITDGVSDCHMYEYPRSVATSTMRSALAFCRLTALTPGTRSEQEAELGLDIVELVMTVEEKFGVHIPDQEALGATTPGKLTDLVFAKLTASGTPNRWTKDDVWIALREIIVEQTGVTDFTKDSHFVDDMRLD
jgi:hypothetical protein